LICSVVYCVKGRIGTNKEPSTRERRTNMACLIMILLHTNIMNWNTTLIQIDTIEVPIGKMYDVSFQKKLEEVYVRKNNFALLPPLELVENRR